jgi:hypothetical protein
MPYTCLGVASFIVTYNAFISGDDHLDQKGATNATKRCEKKVYMSIFTINLDLACTQPHALFVSTQKKTKIRIFFEFIEFKWQIVQDLVTPWRCVNNKLTPEKRSGLNLDSQSKQPLPNKLYLPQPLPKEKSKKRAADVDHVVDNKSHPSPNARCCQRKNLWRQKFTRTCLLLILVRKK